MVLLALLGAVVIAAAALNRIQKKTPVPPAAPTLSMAQEQKALRSARLMAVPSSDTDSFKVGEQQSVELRIDTMGQSIVVIEAYLTYDSAAMEVTGIEGRGSVLPLEVLSEQQALAAPGTVRIVRGIPRDAGSGKTGFQGEGAVVVLNIKPFKAGQANLTVDAQKSKYVPSDAEEMFAFSEMQDGAFTVAQ